VYKVQTLYALRDDDRKLY